MSYYIAEPCIGTKDTACVEVCPTQARVFGESGKKSSPLRRFMRFNEISILKAYLNTEPRVYYAGMDGKVI